MVLGLLGVQPDAPTFSDEWDHRIYPLQFRAQKSKIFLDSDGAPLAPYIFVIEEINTSLNNCKKYHSAQKEKENYEHIMLLRGYLIIAKKIIFSRYEQLYFRDIFILKQKNLSNFMYSNLLVESFTTCCMHLFIISSCMCIKFRQLKQQITINDAQICEIFVMLYCVVKYG